MQSYTIEQEKLDMVQTFKNSTLIEAKEIFGDKMLWNNVAGTAFGQFILKTSRNIDPASSWSSSDRLFYTLKAQPQAGKTKAQLSCLIYLARKTKECYKVVYYCCNGRKDLHSKTIKEIEEFFKNLKADVYYDDENCIEVDLYPIDDSLGSIEIYVLHNTSGDSQKEEVFQSFKENDEIQRIILWDEADQAFLKSSKREAFMSSMLSLKDPYSMESISKRQSKNLTEVSISATPFVNEHVHREFLNQFSEEFSLEIHPRYEGLSQIHNKGYLFNSFSLFDGGGRSVVKVDNAAVQKYMEELVTPFMNSEATKFVQNKRPVSVTRIYHGNKMHSTLFDSIRDKTNKTVGVATDWTTLDLLLKDKKTEMILLFYNNSGGKLPRAKLDKFLRKQKKNYSINGFCNKKVSIFIDGTMKEGDDILSKNKEIIAYFFDRPTKNDAPIERTIQSMGRVCSINFTKRPPPLCFGNKQCIKPYQDYFESESNISSQNMRGGSKKKHFKFPYVWLFALPNQQTLQEIKDLYAPITSQLSKKTGLSLKHRAIRGQGAEVIGHNENYIKTIYSKVESVHECYRAKATGSELTSDDLALHNAKGDLERVVFYDIKTQTGNFASVACLSFKDLSLAEQFHNLVGIGKLFSLKTKPSLNSITMVHPKVAK